MDVTANASASSGNWLRTYYAARAVFSVLWVVLAYTLGKSQPAAATALIIAYPAWDALANYLDAARSGGLRANPTQRLNVVLSAVVTIAVIAAVTRGFHDVMVVIGIWASISGILQLATALRRWKSARAQWPMILSGAQSALAGALFVKMGFDQAAPAAVTNVAGYAAVGAAYFAVSALALTFSRKSAPIG